MQSHKNRLIPLSFSVYLDFLRISAAFFVFIYHLKSRNLGNPTFLNLIPNISHFAVILFFVLSGYLIATSVDSKRELGLRHYILDRLSRVYSVAIPALVLSLVFALIYSKNSINSELLAILSNFLFLGQSWSFDLNPFWNIPYWSLCYEVMYYILFGCFIFFKGWQRWLLILLFATVAGIKVLLLIPCWLFGVAIYRTRDLIKLNILMAGILAFALPLACAIIFYYFRIHQVTGKLSALFLGDYYELAGFSANFLTDFLVAAIFAIHIYAMRYFVINFNWQNWLAKAIQGSAAMSFTLYLMHQPLIRFVDYLAGPARSNVLFIGCLVSIPLICYVISLFTEAKRSTFKIWISKTTSI